MQAGPLPFLFQQEDHVVEARIVAQADAEADQDERGDDQERMAGHPEQEEGNGGQELGAEQVSPFEMPAFVPAEEKESQEQGEPQTAHEEADGVGSPAEIPGELGE